MKSREPSAIPLWQAGASSKANPPQPQPRHADHIAALQFQRRWKTLAAVALVVGGADLSRCSVVGESSRAAPYGSLASIVGQGHSIVLVRKYLVFWSFALFRIRVNREYEIKQTKSRALPRHEPSHTTVVGGWCGTPTQGNKSSLHHDDLEGRHTTMARPPKCPNKRL